MELEYDAQNQLTKAVVTKHLNTNPITQEYSYTYAPQGHFLAYAHGTHLEEE